MEILKNKKLFLVTGIILLTSSIFVFVDYVRSDWQIKISGNQTILESEIERYVLFYINQNQDRIVPADIEQILLFHPRIESAIVKKRFKQIVINLKEKQTGFLLHQKNTISEISLNGTIIQESVSEKSSLSENFSIFYLTAENEPEIETIKGDIIQLWEKTGVSHSFIWSRISEIELTQNEMNNPVINLYYSFFPFKITLHDKMDINSLRKLWAIFNLLESQNLREWKLARIYQDHAVLE
jgi:hypothetical protein